jgi:hypothetical protein
MMSRPERNDHPLRGVKEHLNHYLDKEVAASRRLSCPNRGAQ